jgi:hypothetical protein
MELSFSPSFAPDAKSGPSGQCRVVSVDHKKKKGFKLNLGIVRFNKGGSKTTTTHIECDE